MTADEKRAAEEQAGEWLDEVQGLRGCVMLIPGTTLHAIVASLLAAYASHVKALPPGAGEWRKDPPTAEEVKAGADYWWHRTRRPDGEWYRESVVQLLDSGEPPLIVCHANDSSDPLDTLPADDEWIPIDPPGVPERGPAVLATYVGTASHPSTITTMVEGRGAPCERFVLDIGERLNVHNGQRVEVVVREPAEGGGREDT